jgi:chemotaxis methyl-accepting protein methylase
VTAGLFSQLIERFTGLAIDRGGMSTALERFVTERMRKLGLPRIEDYVALTADPMGAEQRLLIDAITVPHTWFFRDPEQLQTIAGLIAAAPPGPVAVWVAGCATGEEAYTLSMIGRRLGREVAVLATDVNEKALAAAQRGVYSASAVRDVPAIDRRWISEHDQGFLVDPALRSNVSFVRHNLVDSPPHPPRGGWDLVVCRNVLIYFAPAAAARVLERFARALRVGGTLVVGGSEVVFDPPTGLKLVASGTRLVLRRTDSPAAAPAIPFSRPPRPTPTPITVSTGPRLVSSTDAPVPRLAPAPAPAPVAVPTPVPVPAPVVARRAPTADPTGLHDPTGPHEVRDEHLITGLNRGHAQFERGEHRAAIAVFEELVRLYPSEAEVWLFLGIARYAQGLVPEAANALRSSLCLKPELWPAGFYLARAYDRLGRRADALRQYDLIAVDDLQPLVLKSTSAVINELRALGHDFRTAARRVAAERPMSPRPPARRPSNK